MKLRTFAHPYATGCAWFGSNSLITVGSDKSAKYWDLTTGENTDVFTFGAYAEQIVTQSGVAYVGQSDGTITNSFGHSFQSDVGRITEMAVSGDRLAVGGVAIENGMTVCRLVMMTLNGFVKWRHVTSNIVYGLAFNPDGDVIFSGEGNGVVARRSSETGAVLNSRGSFTNSIVDLCYHKSHVWVGQLNSSTLVPSLWLIDETSLDHVASLGFLFPSGVWSMGLNVSGALLGVTGNRNELVVFDHMAGTLIYANPRSSIGKKLAWHPTRVEQFAVCMSDSTVEIHDLQPESVPSPIPTPPAKPGKGRRK